MRDDGGAAIFDEPFAVVSHQTVVDAEVFVKLREGGGHDAFPVDFHNSNSR